MDGRHLDARRLSLYQKSMRLADFILRHMETILAEWEAFAGTLFPAAASMTPLALRDEAKEILEAVAKDLSTSQTKQAQIDKSLGRAPKLLDARKLPHKPMRYCGREAVSTLTSWPPNTAPCAPASFACGPNHVSLMTLIWKMSFASTKPSTKRSPNRSNFLANKWSGRAICCSVCLAMTCAIRSMRSR